MEFKSGRLLRELQLLLLRLGLMDERSKAADANAANDKAADDPAASTGAADDAAADRFQDKLDKEISCFIRIFTGVQAIAVVVVANSIHSSSA